MIALLKWLRSTLAGVLNALARTVVAILLLLLILLAVGLARGDGLPGNMLLTLDLRKPIADSATGPAFPLAARPPTVMELIFSLDAASHDRRVKGLVMRLGGGGLSIAQAEELGVALRRFRASGKFVIAQATGFFGAGMGDYLTAAAADQIWVQPKSSFAVSGAGGGEIFLRGLFDKLKAEPQIAKRAEYKSAADMYMEKTMSGPDREQLNAVMTSWYESALTAAATARRLTPGKVAAAFDASPQFAEEALGRGLIDRLGYDDDALAAARARAGQDVSLVRMGAYRRSRVPGGAPANIAVILAAGEIVDGTARGDVFGGSSGIASDDLSAAIRQAAADRDIKAIVLRVDSPGGSVTASDQILDAVKKAQKKGKPVVVSMGGVAASGGYYISTSADKIVAEPATLTGSIGVLTGKVSVGKSLDLLGVGFTQVSIGRNTLMDSALSPYTPDQWAALNHEADVIYQDFLAKVATGRKLPLAKVAAAARGRVWTGADARAQGLVDELGGFWTAAGLAAQAGGVAKDQLVFKLYPRPQGLVERLESLMGGTDAGLEALEVIHTLSTLPGMTGVIQAVREAPKGRIELRAANLPRALGN